MPLNELNISAKKHQNNIRITNLILDHIVYFFFRLFDEHFLSRSSYKINICTKNTQRVQFTKGFVRILIFGGNRFSLGHRSVPALVLRGSENACAFLAPIFFFQNEVVGFFRKDRKIPNIIFIQSNFYKAFLSGVGDRDLLLEECSVSKLIGWLAWTIKSYTSLKHSVSRGQLLEDSLDGV